LPAGRFCFEGFLPRSGSGRAERLEAVAGEPRTTVLYEAPHRVRRTVADLVAACGPHRRVAVCRELTKAFEETWRGSLGAAAEHLADTEPRGEYVLVLDGAPPPDAAGDDQIVAALAEEKAAGASTRDAASTVALRLGVPRKRVYDLATRR
jgi:16S rRNA (cytidine1402-2'-O)-methyltransferase